MMLYASWPGDRPEESPGGKSELHRAGRWITSSGGDSKESATEIYRLLYLQVRVER